jgi:two-component system, chemotaxis family, protein-glutamate methylesterase/glutaminase
MDRVRSIIGRYDEPPVRSFAIITIGCSAGCVEALQKVVNKLDPDIPAALFVVLHIGRRRSYLDEILSRVAPMPVSFARQGDAINPRRLLIAPPDYHVHIHHGFIRLSRGPAENWARPAVDPLFRSAATAYGRRVIGVVLTGLLSDGTAGLIAVRKAKGIAVVQDPADAIQPMMPQSALSHAGADYCCPLAQIPGLLLRLAEGIATGAGQKEMEVVDERHRRERGLPAGSADGLDLP